MLIEFRDLRWAVMASQHSSLRRAAHALNVRQSTLSRRLKDMEERIGARLFERTNGGTHPTLIGREFLTHARHLLEETKSALKRLKMRSRGENGRLSIGVYASFSTGNMLASLLDHHRSFPDVEVYTVDGSNDQLMMALESGSIDIAIATENRCDWEERRLPLWSERIIVALPASHPFSEMQSIRWSELAREEIIIPQGGPGAELERLLTMKLGSCGPKRLRYQGSGLDRLLSLVSAGYGILLMLEGATGIHFDNVVYREVLDDSGPTRVNFTAYWLHANRNPTLPPFLAMLTQRYPDLSPDRLQS